MVKQSEKNLADMTRAELAALSPAQIYRLSGQSLAGLIDLSGITPALQPMARRLVHASADPSVIEGLGASPGAVTQLAQALQAASPILVDCAMVAAGLASRYGGKNEIICTLNHPMVAELAAKLNLTRSAAAVELWRGYKDAIAVFGNAPTALFRYLALLEAGDMPKPCGILGFVVGYVGAAEAKQALSEQTLVPWIALAGRRGGSALAVAAVNGLAANPENQILATALAPAPPAPPGKATDAANPAPVQIIGVGAEGLASLAPRLRQVIADADVILGGERHLAMAGLPQAAQKFAWQTPLSRTVAQLGELLAANPRPKIVVLATGDPMWFGIGVTLARQFGAVEAGGLSIHPHLSAFSLAAARLGWPLAACDCLTLHGRDLAVVRRYLRPQARLLMLSENRHTPRQLARLLVDAGLGGVRLTILSEMGAAAEMQAHFRADILAAGGTAGEDFADLNTIALDGGSVSSSDFPPDCAASAAILPDHAFSHDGMISKQMIRSQSLALMSPAPGEIWWDIGAGSGAVAIEIIRAQFMRQAALTGQVFAIEENPRRAEICQNNAMRLGFPELRVVVGSAPAALVDLPPPQGIFLGGGLRDDVFDAAYNALAPNGKILANGVTLAGEAAILRWHAQYGGAIQRVSLSQSQAMQGEDGSSPQVLRPSLAVTQYFLRV